jgi:hypothetical protein
MTSLISLSAINKVTGEYVYPKIANKKDEYSCPECNKDLILCQGDVRIHHFRHKVATNPCHHYSNPTETQIHKDAKLLMKTLLDKKIPVSFVRKCCCCKKNEEFEIPETSETSDVRLEHRFEYHGPKIADVAYIENGEILCIFEICNTHKTRGENRPEPWFEIDAETLIRIANDNCLSQIQIPCIRCEKCEGCVEKEKQQVKKEINRISSFWAKIFTKLEWDWEYRDGVLCSFIIKFPYKHLLIVVMIDKNISIEKYREEIRKSEWNDEFLLVSSILNNDDVGLYLGLFGSTKYFAYLTVCDCCKKNTIWTDESWIFCRNCGSDGSHKSLYRNIISPWLYVGHKCGVGISGFFKSYECNCITHIKNPAFQKFKLFLGLPIPITSFFN